MGRSVQQTFTSAGRDKEKCCFSWGSLCDDAGNQDDGSDLIEGVVGKIYDEIFELGAAVVGTAKAEIYFLVQIAIDRLQGANSPACPLLHIPCCQFLVLEDRQLPQGWLGRASSAHFLVYGSTSCTSSAWVTAKQDTADTWPFTTGMSHAFTSSSVYYSKAWHFIKHASPLDVVGCSRRFTTAKCKICPLRSRAVLFR